MKMCMRVMSKIVVTNAVRMTHLNLRIKPASHNFVPATKFHARN